MKDLVDSLDALDAALAGVVQATLCYDALSRSTDDELIGVLGRAASISRRAEALLIEATSQIEQRSTDRPHDERLTTGRGCRSVNELIQRVTRVSSRSAAALLRAARAVEQPFALSSGQLLPAQFPAMRDALIVGSIGIDGLIAVTDALRSAAPSVAQRLAADEELAATAGGNGADGAPPACADDLKALAMVWAMYFDQDGIEPREARAMRKRGIWIGACQDGIAPVRGNLLAEAAGQLQLVLDSILNPKVEGIDVPRGPYFAEDAGGSEDEFTPSAEERTGPQMLHDAFASALGTLAASGDLPALGGAAPTLVVSVRAEDLRENEGFAHIAGCDEPIPLGAARHIACTGVVQRVVSEVGGRIVAIETSDRVFNHHQRKAIALRDGACIIPGCRVRASWCEIHHVQEHSRGGPTHTDNGVMICWHHHRTLDTSGWSVRMNSGTPEVRGPSWWDPKREWRSVTTSPVRMREKVARRT